ncbi:MAG: DUF2225 domain-containing protein [Chthoniobacteraceae bacterium]
MRAILLPMRFLFSLLPLLFLACVAGAVNTLEQDFLCPICGTRWEQRIETSGHSRGMRLDLRQLGDVVDPPTLPQCPKCRFPLFSDRLVAQANDPAKAQAFKRLRSFVRGPDFQMLASKNPSYFCLAQVQEFLGAPHRHIALSYLRASWQVEDREAVCRRFLEKAREYFVAALAGMGEGDRKRNDVILLCGEMERRLGRWDDAERRFRELESSGLLKGTEQSVIPAMQLALIARRDSAPHPLDAADALVHLPAKSDTARDERPMLRLENPGRAEKPEDALKLAQPPKPPAEPAVQLGPPAPVPDSPVPTVAPPPAPDAPPNPLPLPEK